MELKFSKYIEHTMLKPFATAKDIEKLCSQAIEYDFFGVCVNPFYVSLAKEGLEGSDIKVCTVIGFPLGANSSKIKGYETREALKSGADEFDMVINIGALKDKRYDKVSNDIREVVKSAEGRVVKTIIETGLLTDEEKRTASIIACEAGAMFVKTCTGFSGGVATVEDIMLIKSSIASGVGIKASGGIKDFKTARALITAGASRLGTSSGVEIVSLMNDEGIAKDDED